MYSSRRGHSKLVLEELREYTGMRVDHVDVGVAVVRESFSDVTL